MQTHLKHPTLFDEPAQKRQTNHCLLGGRILFIFFLFIIICSLICKQSACRHHLPDHLFLGRFRDTKKSLYVVLFNGDTWCRMARATCQVMCAFLKAFMLMVCHVICWKVEGVAFGAVIKLDRRRKRRRRKVGQSASRSVNHRWHHGYTSLALSVAQHSLNIENIALKMFMIFLL